MECSKTFLELNMHFVIQTSPLINKIRCLLKGILYIYQNKDFLDNKSQSCTILTQSCKIYSILDIVSNKVRFV